MNKPEQCGRKNDERQTHTTMSETTDATNAENSTVEYGREQTVYGNSLGIAPKEVPRKTDLAAEDFEGESVTFGRDGQIADSAVKKTVIRDFYDFGESWDTVKTATIDVAENAFADGSIDEFEENGRRMREHFMTADAKQQEELVAFAVGVQFASYRCEEARLASIVENTAGTGLDAAEQIVRRSPKGGQTFPLFRDFVAASQHTRLAEILVEQDADSAREYAISEVEGMSHRKAGFWLMLLGFNSAFALDVNVRAIITPYVQKTLSVAPDSVDECQKCRNACWNDKNDMPRIDGPSHKLEGWYGEPGVFYKNRSYLAYHMLDHIGSYDHGAKQYCDLIIKFFREELGRDLSNRTATQIMFNAGMIFTESASNENPDRDSTFYGHEYFYDSIL